MEKVTLESTLQDSIRQLESKHAEEEMLLKQQFHYTMDCLKPVNLIKSTMREVVSSDGLKGDAITASIGLGAGLLSKILFSGVMKSPLRKVIGTALMFGVTNLVARNPEKVKSIGKGLFNLIRKKKDHSYREVVDFDDPIQLG